MRIKKKKKVLVGISGGVDSSVTAFLLKKKGYEVEGIFLDFWESEKSRDAFKSAESVAKTLKIPLTKIDARKEFKRIIVEEFIEQYKKGQTPNPCVVCNPQMKFKVLLDEAEKKKADFVATGHYAKVKCESQNYLKKLIFRQTDKSCDLLKAKDKTKDQSYFLYGLSPTQLEKIIFPLGDYLKTEVRKIARKIGLPTAQREESQDVCFITQAKFGDFLKKYIRNNKGEIVNENGAVLGRHYGLSFYTIGQRKGIDLGGNGPYYVIGKDVKKNRLIVSNDEQKLFSDNFLVKNVNWIISESKKKFPLKAKIKVRYHSNLIYGIIKPHGVDSDLLEVRLSKSQKAITPGQSAVFYDGDKVLGGGVIV